MSARLVQRDGAWRILPIAELNAVTKQPLARPIRPLTEDTLRHIDLVLIATDHTNIDYQFLVDHSKCVVDTRNATRRVVRGLEKISRA